MTPKPGTPAPGDSGEITFGQLIAEAAATDPTSRDPKGVYLFAGKSNADIAGPSTVFQQIQDDGNVRSLIQLFTRTYGTGAGGQVFAWRGASRMDRLDRALVDEALGYIEVDAHFPPDAWETTTDPTWPVRVEYWGRTNSWQGRLEQPDQTRESDGPSKSPAATPPQPSNPQATSSRQETPPKRPPPSTPRATPESDSEVFATEYTSELRKLFRDSDAVCIVTKDLEVGFCAHVIPDYGPIVAAAPSWDFAAELIGLYQASESPDPVRLEIVRCASLTTEQKTLAIRQLLQRYGVDPLYPAPQYTDASDQCAFLMSGYVEELLPFFSDDRKSLVPSENPSGQWDVSRASHPWPLPLAERDRGRTVPSPPAEVLVVIQAFARCYHKIARAVLQHKGITHRLEIPLRESHRWCVDSIQTLLGQRAVLRDLAVQFQPMRISAAGWFDADDELCSEVSTHEGFLKAVEEYVQTRLSAAESSGQHHSDPLEVYRVGLRLATDRAVEHERQAMIPIGEVRPKGGGSQGHSSVTDEVPPSKSGPQCPAQPSPEDGTKSQKAQSIPISTDPLQTFKPQMAYRYPDLADFHQAVLEMMVKEGHFRQSKKAHPTQRKIIEEVGDGKSFSNKARQLAEMVDWGFLDNLKGRGKRGGYFITFEGIAADRHFSIIRISPK